MSEEATNGKAHIDIGLLGPRGVGKTSLVVAMMDAGAKSLAGTPVTVAASPRSAARINKFKAQLRSWVRSGEFRSPALAGTPGLDRLEFELSVDRDPSIGVSFEIMDYPGGWLGLSEKPKDYDEFLRHVEQSAILLVVIDSTYIMEASELWVREGLDEAIQIVPVESVVRTWAKSRIRQTDEPAVLMFVPVKCETYLPDNGGRLDFAEKLFDQVNEYYGEAIEIAEAEFTAAQIDSETSPLEVLYCPVDTLGAVDLESGDWLRDEDGLPAFQATFHLRDRAKAKQKGAPDVMSVIASRIVQASERLERPEAQAARERAARAADRASEDRGWLGNIWWGISGKRKVLKKKAEEKDVTALQREARLDHLTHALDQLATTPDESRLRRVTED